MSKVDGSNICTITFSEPVNITDFEEFSKTLKAQITGPKSSYSFKYDFYHPSAELKNSKTVTSFQIKVYEIMNTIEGDGREKIKFWLEDLTTVTDLAGNIFAEGIFTGSLKHFEYVSKS